MTPITAWLDNRLFPRIVSFATNRIHIMLLVLLWVALLIFGSYTIFSLTGGNYFNGLCGLVSCILLGKQMQHHAENRRLHAGNAAQLTALQQQHEADAARHEDMMMQVVRSQAALAASHESLHAKVDALATPPPQPASTPSRDDKGRFTKAAPVATEGASS